MNLNNYISNNIIWDGKDIPCLNLCKGDYISDVIYKMAKRICELLQDVDLSEIDIDCIINKCDESLCLEDRSIFNILKILQKNDCSLKELLDNVIDSINEKKNLQIKVDLSCLKSCSDYTVPKYNFLCAFNGNTGDEIEVIYSSSYDNVQHTVILKKGQCLRFDYPKDIISIIKSTVITGGSNIQVKVNISIGFNNCTECGVYINNLIDNVSFPGYNKQKEFSLNTLLQYLIYRECCQHQLLIDANDTLSILEQDYTKIISGFSSYIEPSLITCFNNNKLLHSLLTPKLSQEACLIRSNIGTHSEIINSINNACIGSFKSINFPNQKCDPFTNQTIYINTVLIDSYTFIINKLAGNGEMLSFLNILNSNLPDSFANFTEENGQLIYNSSASNITVFITDCNGVGNYAVDFVSNLSPALNLAQDSKNQWSVLCNILTRIKNKENSACCLPDCGEVKIGYKLLYSETDDTYRIIFNKTYGTSIKEGWKDNGSIITLKDINNITSIQNIEITEDSIIDLSVDGLSTSSPISVLIKSNFIHTNGLVCKDVFFDHLDIKYGECAFCKLCVYGTTSSDQIRVVYHTDSNPTNIIQTLSVGSCLYFKLPNDNPTIVSLMRLNTDSDAILAPDPSSDCSEDIILPEIKSDGCWFFEIPTPTNTYKAAIGQFFNLGTLGADSEVDFDLKPSYDLIEDYGIYTDINNPQGIPLSGKIASVDITRTDNLTTTSQADQISVKHAVPIYSSPVIKQIKLCTDVYVIEPKLEKTGGSVTGAIINPLANKSLVKIANAGLGTGDLEVGRVITNNGSKSGILMTISGLEAGSDQPTISLINPINGATSYIKGIAVDDCSCPT